MEQIIYSTKKNRTLQIVFLVIMGIVDSILAYYVNYYNTLQTYYWEMYHLLGKHGYRYDYSHAHDEYENLSLALILCIILFLAGIFDLCRIGGGSVYVTSERVYGKGAFGKEFSIPYSNIVSARKGSSNTVILQLSRGVYKISGVRYPKLVYDAINGVLNGSIQPQNPAADAPNADSTADQLKKYNELLQSGAITQEEFDSMKKKLLGLD